MTIAVAVRTSSAVVFAADSKVTTNALAGFDSAGDPIWQDQTYDHAFKLAHDREENLMAMVAGHANIGQIAATDFIATQHFLPQATQGAQDRERNQLLEKMVDEKKSCWSTTKVASDQWPGPILLLATASIDRRTPHVWRVDLRGKSFDLEEILKSPDIRFEGSYNEVFSLLYGYHPQVLAGITGTLGIQFPNVQDAIDRMTTLRPKEKFNFSVMPLQDAIDLSVFLAQVQIQMDRFLPGTPACGGPIDVMVLQMVPTPQIVSFPGKTIHHPHSAN